MENKDESREDAEYILNSDINTVISSNVEVIKDEPQQEIFYDRDVRESHSLRIDYNVGRSQLLKIIEGLGK